MDFNNNEIETISRSLEMYKSTINFVLANRKAKRSNPQIKKYVDLYENDLKVIENILNKIKY